MEDKAHLPSLVILLNPSECLGAIKECTTMRIPTIGIVDTDTDPRIVTYPIPANMEVSCSATCAYKARAWLTDPFQEHTHDRAHSGHFEHCRAGGTAASAERGRSGGKGAAEDAELELVPPITVTMHMWLNAHRFLSCFGLAISRGVQGRSKETALVERASVGLGILCRSP